MSFYSFDYLRGYESGQADMKRGLKMNTRCLMCGSLSLSVMCDRCKDEHERRKRMAKNHGKPSKPKPNKPPR